MSLSRTALRLLCLPVGLLAIGAGCVSLNSSDPSRRAAAFDALKVDKDYLAVLTTSPHHDLRIRAAQSVTNTASLIPFATGEGDIELRKIVIQRIDDQDAISRVALGDADPELRRIAIQRVRDQDALSKIALGDSVAGLRQLAVSQISQQARLASVFVESSDPAVQEYCLLKLENPGEINSKRVQVGIGRAFLTTTSMAVREAAFSKLTTRGAFFYPRSQRVIADLVLGASSEKVRHDAFDLLVDPAALLVVAMRSPRREVAEKAIRGLDTPDAYLQVARSAECSFARHLAFKMISRPDHFEALALYANDPFIRAAAVATLPNSTALQKALNDPHPKVREAAAKRQQQFKP